MICYSDIVCRERAWKKRRGNSDVRSLCIFAHSERASDIHGALKKEKQTKQNRKMKSPWINSNARNTKSTAYFRSLLYTHTNTCQYERHFVLRRDSRLSKRVLINRNGMVDAVLRCAMPSHPGDALGLESAGEGGRGWGWRTKRVRKLSGNVGKTRYNYWLRDKLCVYKCIIN